MTEFLDNIGALFSHIVCHGFHSGLLATSKTAKLIRYRIWTIKEQGQHFWFLASFWLFLELVLGQIKKNFDYQGIRAPFLVLGFFLGFLGVGFKTNKEFCDVSSGLSGSNEIPCMWVALRNFLKKLKCWDSFLWKCRGPLGKTWKSTFLSDYILKKNCLKAMKTIALSLSHNKWK